MWERRESFFFAIIPGEVIPPEDWMDYLRASRDGFVHTKQEYIAYKKRAMDAKIHGSNFFSDPEGWFVIRLCS